MCARHGAWCNLTRPAGQKCSALSRLYVSSSVWKNGFKEQLLAEVAKLKVGPATDFTNFIGPVIGRPAFDKITGYIQKAKDAGGEVLVGGGGRSHPS